MVFITAQEWDHAHAKAWADHVWHHLQDLQISSSNLAFVIGVTTDVVNEWLIGEQRPSPGDCKDLARALSMSPVLLLELAGYDIVPGSRPADEAPAAGWNTSHVHCDGGTHPA